jgi:protein ImuB
MPRLASLCLPDLGIDRIRLAARPPSPPERAATSGADVLLAASGGGWRPGARWARETPAALAIKGDGEGALVTSRREGNRDVIAAACGKARSLGLLPGTPLTKARILVPGLDVRGADDEGDAAWLARLGLFAARRWTPRAAVSGPDGLWLDLGGAAHLFGGERKMCERILAFCKRLGFTARIAVAGSSGAAHALARFAADSLILCPPGGEAEAIGSFPLAALRLDEAALNAARRLGIEWIGELIDMPRAPLQRRFGAELLLRLDQALGRVPEPFDPIVAVEAPAILLRFMEPIATAEAIGEATGEAVRRLMVDLAKTGLAVRQLILWCERVDGALQHIGIGTARPTRDGAHLHRLLSARIETIEPGFGIERIRLVATRVEPLGPRPIVGALTGEAAAPDLAPLIDRLAMRLGARRLYRLSGVESDVPERSVRRADPLAKAKAWPSWPRPVRLLAPPEPVEGVIMVLPDGAPMRFQWRGKAYRVAAADGPERIYGEWWKRAEEVDANRDYFQVEDMDGKRFWLFRRGDSRDPAATGHNWYLHGIFA